MNPDWQDVLYSYVKIYNEMETNYAADPLLRIIDDIEYVKLEQARLTRLKDWHRERMIRPVKNESKMRILSARKENGRVRIRFEVRRSFFYQAKEQTFQELRKEQRSVRMAEQGGKWRIDQVTVPLAEKQYIPVPPAYSEWNFGMPGPYINHQLLGNGIPYVRNRRYEREKAKHYADQWWDLPNPEFKHFSVDCTNFISQCLYAGNAPMHYTGKRASGWWYRGGSGKELWSYSWAVSHSLQWYLRRQKGGLRADPVESPEQLQIADVIFYDWDGDGNFQHSVIVTAKDAHGMPLVNAHTVNSKRRYWDYRDSYAWSESTKYSFLHIADIF